MKVINLWGGPGSGKSTVAAGLFYHMKMRHLNVELVTEYAKDLVYSNTLSVLKNYQEFIFAEQNRRQQILEGKVDWAITDSPLLLSHIYGVDRQQANLASFLKLVSDTFHLYNNVSFFLERPSQFLQVGRDHNLDQSKLIDEKILHVLNNEGIDFVRLPADNNTIEIILSYVLK